MTKSMRVSWAEHVARTGRMRNAISSLENLKGREHLEDLGLEGRKI
jgi:hypothetical protein